MKKETFHQKMKNIEHHEIKKEKQHFIDLFVVWGVKVCHVYVQIRCCFLVCNQYQPITGFQKGVYTSKTPSHDPSASQGRIQSSGSIRADTSK